MKYADYSNYTESNKLVLALGRGNSFWKKKNETLVKIYTST